MVSHRCKMMVIDELKKVGLQYTAVDLGMVETLQDISEEQRSSLERKPAKVGIGIAG